MMLLITFDRNGLDQDRSRLHREIETAGRWWHHLESTWIVCTDLTPAQWADRLRRHLVLCHCMILCLTTLTLTPCAGGLEPADPRWAHWRFISVA